MKSTLLEVNNNTFRPHEVFFFSLKLCRETPRCDGAIIYNTRAAEASVTGLCVYNIINRHIQIIIISVFIGSCAEQITIQVLVHHGFSVQF